jgi:hypothetical protein
MGADSRFTLRAAAPIAALALALGGVGCGDSDDNDDGAAKADEKKSAAMPGAATPQGAAEEEIFASYEDFIKAFYAKDPKGLCDTFTEQAQKTFRQGKRTCEQQARAMFVVEPSPSRPYITKLKVNGSTAVVYVRTKSSNTYTVPFAKEDGVWKSNNLDGGEVSSN